MRTTGDQYDESLSVRSYVGSMVHADASATGAIGCLQSVTGLYVRTSELHSRPDW